MTLVNTIWCASDSVKDSRTCSDVLTHAMTELGELAQEVQIHAGKSYKMPGSDGVVGEALDVIACMVDMIRVHDPNLTESDLMRIMQPKLEKWHEKSQEILQSH
jgi:NTP pyrophosphatase (non-canonical NTP hydrolase)